jgi:hypothetical protein
LSGKRVGTIVLICLMLLIMTGCSRPAATEPPETTPEETPGEEPPASEEPEPEAPTPPERTTLGGVSLGDDTARVQLMLGNNYAEEILPEDPFYSQGTRIWAYPKGITVTFSLKSDRMVHLEVTAVDCATNLGVRVGDSAADVLAEYRTVYEEYEGLHSDGAIPGWFRVENGGLLIFDFDREDGALANSDVGAEAVVEAIVLAQAADFD